jgi:hypothetical protein
MEAMELGLLHPRFFSSSSFFFLWVGLVSAALSGFVVPWQ